MGEETWKPVPGYEGLYEVSDQGRVRSLDRYVANKGRWGTVVPHHRPGRPLKPGRSSNGYVSVSLAKGGKRRSYLVQELVMLAFIGPRPQGHVIRHLDGTRLNNHLSNLGYSTPRENCLDRARHGTTKIKRHQVLDIRARILMGETQSSIAISYGISQAAVSLIKLGKQFAHV